MADKVYKTIYGNPSRHELWFGKKIGMQYDNEYSYYSLDLENKMKELKEIYGNTPYWQELLQNPWLQYPNIPQRDEGYWRDFAREYKLNAMNYIADVVQRANQQKYDSALSQVQRERQAGLNPDLGGVSPGEAADPTELPVEPGMSMSDWKAQQVQNQSSLFGIGQAFISTFFQLADNIQGLQQGSLDKANQELGLLAGSDAFAQSFRIDHANLFPDPEASEPENNILPAIASAIGNRPLSKKTRKFVKHAFGSYAGDNQLSIRGGVQKKVADFVSDRWKAVEGKAKVGWNDDELKMIAEVEEDYSKIAFDIWKSQQDLMQQVIQFQSDYWNTMNDNQAGNTQGSVESQNLNNELQYVTELGAKGVPGMRAESERASLEIKKLQDAIQKSQTERMEQVEKDISALYDKYLKKDSTWAQIARIALPIVKSLLIQNIMSYSQNAMESLAKMQFSHQPVAPVTYDYSSRNTSIFNNGE